MDEDSFLLSVHEQYGGVVYLPWPLCQFLVTDKQLIETVYSTSSKSLAFVSLQARLSSSRFGLVIVSPATMPQSMGRIYQD